MRVITSGFVLLVSFGHLHHASARPHAKYKKLTQPGWVEEVIVQMFEWDWDSIATECTDFLGPAGYGFVQVSPPQEHVEGPQWWTDYQPVSYNITSKRGNREQFANMITKCQEAKVRVIVDTIFNHMSGREKGTGVAGSPFEHYSYPSIYGDSDFHHCGLTTDDQIEDYTSRAQVQTCELLGLADLATETEDVRARLAQYGNDLISLGVYGLRLDAAKHIAAADLDNITDRLTEIPYLTQEVIYGEGEPILPTEYTEIGDVQEFRYTTALKDAFLNGNLSWLIDLDRQKGWIEDESANVFVANHDTERNGNSLNYRSPSHTYLNAMIFSLGYDYGTPTILSSYTFDEEEKDEGAPDNGKGSCELDSDEDNSGWLCQHRWPAVVGMVGFRNRVNMMGLTDWFSPIPSRIAFGRGFGGFLAINNNDTQWEETFNTSLKDGIYCDVIYRQPSANPLECTGLQVKVTRGSFTAIVPEWGAIALHDGCMLEESEDIRKAVSFQSVFKYATQGVLQIGGWITTQMVM